MLQTMNTVPTRVLIEHEDPLICAGLCAALDASAEFDIQPSRKHHPDDTPAKAADVLVTDHAQAIRILAGRNDGSFAADRHAAITPATRVLVVTSLAGEHPIRQAVMAGVSGYVLLGGTLAEYVDAVRALGQGMRYVCRRASHELMDSVAQATLTVREREVLCPLVRGLANKAIARELGISVGTVKVHVRSILDKLQASSRTHAASVAAQRGLLEAAASLHHAPHRAAQAAARALDNRPAMPRSRNAYGLSAQRA